MNQLAVLYAYASSFWSPPVILFSFSCRQYGARWG